MFSKLWDQRAAKSTIAANTALVTLDDEIISGGVSDVISDRVDTHETSPFDNSCRAVLNYFTCVRKLDYCITSRNDP